VLDAVVAVLAMKSGIARLGALRVISVLLENSALVDLLFQAGVADALVTYAPADRNLHVCKSSVIFPSLFLIDRLPNE